MNNKVKPYEKLVDYIKSNPKKGLTIPHTDIEKIIGVSYKKSCNCLNKTYTYNVGKANEKLTMLSLRLEPITGYGYRIIKDNQYVDSMRKAYNTATRYIDKAIIIGDNTDIFKLTPDEYAEFDDVFKKVNNAKKTLSTLKKKNTP